ncbi:MAG: undecaprenyldiphospho-muramoylpentapeptide beta-N-acetylglucosaminyltransferase [Bryobacteraceae bacterium]|nr:undecaprenyldiphospho-muramoylpentapeptide beta-N-acetylglucosaminyltransferase [Bryobacteraceae bacterium]
MRFVMAGGGTGGHVMPLLAVASELRRRGHECLFIGTRRGLEARLAPAHGFPIEWIEIGGLQRVGWRQTLRTMAQLPAGVARCLRLLGRFRPSALFSLGGYAAAPPILAAILRRVPVAAMEPNAIPGLVTRRFARFTRRALVQFEETARYFPAGRAELCGLPVRDEFFGLPWTPPEDVFRVLITGGSRGSRTLNRAAREAFPLLAGAPVHLTVQTGEAECEAVTEALAASGGQGEVTAFIDDMPAAYREAHFVVSRSGAGAVAELAAAGRPSLLVPFPFAADDHQRHNAEALARSGAALVVSDADLTGEGLAAMLLDLRARPGDLERMSRAARALARPGGAARAAGVLLEVAAAH